MRFIVAALKDDCEKKIERILATWDKFAAGEE